MLGKISKSVGLHLALVAGTCVLGGVAARAVAQSSPPLSAQAQVGQKLFFDTNLSASRKMACATCHDPNSHYGPPNDRPVQLGGPNLTTPGFRAVPTLMYKEYTPSYSDDATNPDGVSANGPGGGFTWDGHANSLAQQVQQPLLASYEMANTSPAAIVQAVQQSSYADLFKAAFGSDVFNDANAAFQDVGLALQAYQMEDSSFHPYTTKFDLYSHNKIGGDLTAAELRGFAVFTDPDRGNCDACHYSGPQVGGGEHEFTDYSYEAIGVPRNSNIPATVTRPGLPVTYFDLGLCTAQNPDSPHTLPDAGQFCGMYKTPTLRNVATRKTFFHNGVFHSLTDVIHWYATRDTNPELWYPTVKGVVQKFNDLPAAYRANIDTQVPLDGLPVGGTPHITDQDRADLECFLNTLTDGYVPPATPATSGPCVN